MKKTFLVFAFVGAMVSLSNPAQARSQKDAPSRIGRITFSELKEACVNPAKFHNQIAPTNIQIACQNLSYKWIPDTEGLLPMPSTRTVKSSVSSDKYTVGTVTAPLASPSQDMNCPRFKQVADKVETVVNVTCDEILAFKGELTDYCTGAVDRLIGGNPAAVTQEDTGMSLDTCQGEARPIQRPVQNQPKQKN
jgi:hypothetical protein